MLSQHKCYEIAIWVNYHIYVKNILIGEIIDLYVLPFLDSKRSDECINFTMMCVFLDFERSDECIDFTMMCRQERPLKSNRKTGIFTVDKKILEDNKILKI
ncbi:Uncharacterized protein FWK35_00025879 [Aphis craccivora]|uniref:Uncharacterized protein n=1 Tax=Aphis craccivora TaxID=307492 RepID=A0A6G0XUI2_APHCR|nr:Uncharacterized protein FWK35_00025879 [Aphis craccivora]